MIFSGNPAAAALDSVARAVLLTLFLAAIIALSQGMPSDRLMLAAAVAVPAAVLLSPAASRDSQGPPWSLLLWVALVLPALPAALALTGVPGAATARLWALAAACSLLVWVCGCIALLLTRRLGDRRTASRAVLPGLLWLFALPLWSAPLVALAGSPRWLVDAVIALCPVSFLAAAADIDYLRGAWFYRHAPYGALRYDYPDAALYAALLLLLSALLLFARGVAGGGQSRSHSPLELST